MAEETSNPQAKFLQGDLLRHIIIMSVSASVGLVSMFLVDFADLFFISLLGKQELAAAVGFAGTLVYFNISLMVGLMIAMGALAAQRIGRGDMEEARRIATSVMALSAIFGCLIALIFWFCAPTFLKLIGAQGETLNLAARYFRIIVPSLPIAMIGMVSSGLLRAHGDAKRAMQATLSAGGVNAVLDPLLIFGLGLGLDGAAFASVGARLAMMATALYPIIKDYGGFVRLRKAAFKNHISPILGIAVPAVLTNIATPLGTIIVTRAIAPYGDEVVAGFAVIGRLMPLAFCVLFALSGAIGPIIGQNFGAQNYGRVRGTFTRALAFATAYTLVIWVILLLSHRLISNSFGLDPAGSELVFWFAALGTPLFVFNGFLFVCNASFNNLNRPIWSTWLNWGKNTIGLVPLVWFGAYIGGAPGVIIGQALSAVAFAGLGIVFFFRLLSAYQSGAADPNAPKRFALLKGGGSRPRRLG